MGTGKPLRLVFDLKFPDGMRYLHCRNFKSAALAGEFASECQILNSTWTLYLLVVL